eukprot:CAMPEP_0119477182 /NCGR_PEP_ID=MMETSP1344-20130328/7426_1 /TAXON_ID=236787 /ORGANISM="Florenciella parvula, Strain CCMP2471" /LENGTH=137 /DNA_ID=CAMNT_0007511131 /DNA_START=294 /DNA_END=708 /DNA_ORIENTATION=-
MDARRSRTAGPKEEQPTSRAHRYPLDVCIRRTGLELLRAAAAATYVEEVQIKSQHTSLTAHARPLTSPARVSTRSATSALDERCSYPGSGRLPGARLTIDHRAQRQSRASSATHRCVAPAAVPLSYFVGGNQMPADL